MAEIRKLLELLEDTTEDKVNYEEKVIHFQDYSFLFRDWDVKPHKSYVTLKYSSKVTSVGVWREIINESIKDLHNIKDLSDIGLEDTIDDLCYAASLKTLFPNLIFGGDEILFFIWMFVKTPEGYMFPATFYFGPSGTSLGGWNLENAKKVFPPEFFSLINSSPFDITSEERNALVEALELSLKMVPMTDFYGIYQGDNGYTIMGVKDGTPYLMDLGEEYDDNDLDELLKTAQAWGDNFEPF